MESQTAGAVSSQPTGVNNSGDIIGSLINIPAIAPHEIGWLFSNGSWYDLNTLLTTPMSDGWIEKAVGINDGGQIAVVVGHPDLTETGALLTPEGQTGLPPDPPPTINSVSPSGIFQGQASSEIVISGTGFVLGTNVYWNGVAVNTLSTSSTSLTATVPSKDVATAGYATITVVDPGGAISNALVFPILYPAPSLTSITPSLVVAGSPGFTLNVAGNGFVSGSSVYWNGAPLPTNYGSATLLSAVVSGNALTNPSTAAITVVSPAPGGGVSAPVILKINTPAPVAIGINPTSGWVGGAGFMLTVSGTGFRRNVSRVLERYVPPDNIRLAHCLVSPSTSSLFECGRDSDRDSYGHSTGQLAFTEPALYYRQSYASDR